MRGTVLGDLSTYAMCTGRFSCLLRIIYREFRRDDFGEISD